VAARSLDIELSDEYLQRRFRRVSQPQEKIAYEFTRDVGLLDQYYHLREEMFISVWGLKHFCGAKEMFDDISEILVARRGNHCIAGGRLTISTPSQHQMMPMEKEGLSLAGLFPELPLGECTYGEFSRLAILPEFRAGAVFPEIARRFIKRAIAEGVQYAFNIAPQPLARSYRQAIQLFGLNWNIREDIAVPQREEYEGIRMVVSVMDLTGFSRRKLPLDVVHMPQVEEIVG
jgi:hypothetical protein